jgi:RNA polymerase sigma factor for flagellar operon FliA
MCKKLREHAPLVRRLALAQLAKLSANVELDDLIQVGMIGLHDALERWQDTGQAQFESYAITRIKGAMLDECRRGDLIPREVRRKLCAVDATAQLLAHKHSRRPTDSETAEAMDMPVREYQQLISQGGYMVPLEDDHDMPDESANPQDRLQSYRLHKALVKALDSLPDRERFAMSMYYEHNMKLRKIGVVLGVTESRVSQMLRDISLGLREQLHDH